MFGETYLIITMRIPHLIALASLFLGVCAANELNQTIACVQDYLISLKPLMNASLFNVFYKAFPNTLTTTVEHYNLTLGQEAVYIITGDIEAMWLRDSTNQFVPYLRMPKECPFMPNLTRGLINTQSEFVMVDPYTNAFKRFEGALPRPSYLNDRSEKLIFGIPVDLCRGKEHATKTIWERKFEIDSLASFLRLPYEYVRRYNKIDFVNLRFLKALKRVLSVLEEQSKDYAEEKALGKNYYTFYRSSAELPGGVIQITNKTGMIKSGFCPSDSPNELPYNVPGNAMISSYLEHVANLVLSKVPSNSVFKSTADSLKAKMLFYAAQIRNGVITAGMVTKAGKKMYAYAVDGFGNYRLFDDANLPSLLSLPYLGYVDAQDPIYRATRKRILSGQNLFFYSHGSLNGVGSAHTSPRYIWPLALTTQILTSDNQAEKDNCLDSLLKGAKNDLMHESFSVDDPALITRDWFAWANSYFGEMVLSLVVPARQNDSLSSVK